MKQNNIFLGMAGMIATMAMFTACSQNEAEDIAPISKNNVISLTSSMETMRGVSDPQTNALSANNTVGVFVTSGETTITNGDNNKHTVGNGGALSTTTPMYYPAEDGAKVNIYAYAPYKSGIALATASNFSVATDQSAEAGYLSSDLVCASKENQASSESAVSLTFGHKMSQLQITINNQASLDLSEAAVYITGRLRLHSILQQVLSVMLLVMLLTLRVLQLLALIRKHIRLWYHRQLLQIQRW